MVLLFKHKVYFPGDNEAGDVFVGNPDSSGRYENYLQSTNDDIDIFLQVQVIK